MKEVGNLIGVGSGGDLPGIPLKVMCPEISATLLESTGKKADFLCSAVGELKLGSVEVPNNRAEKHRGKYDVATIRAVARLDVNCEYCVPPLGGGGYMISMKSSIDKAEITAGEKATRSLGAEISEIIPALFLPELPDKQWNLVVVRRYTATSSRHPRKKEVPKKNPLGAE